MLKIAGALLFIAAVLPLSAQSVLIIPQVADGGGWQTTLVITNTSQAAATVSLSFHQEIAGGATQAWTPTLLEANSTSNINLAGSSTLVLHTPGTAAATSQGWAELDGPSTVSAYSVFTYRQ